MPTLVDFNNGKTLAVYPTVSSRVFGMSKVKKGFCFLCSKSCSTKCNNCGLVFYCSKEHLGSHRQKGYCFPFRVHRGRVLATRVIQPLELLLFEWSVASGPVEPGLCLECSSKNASYACGMCKQLLCNEDCQLGRNHYHECNIFRSLKDSQYFSKLSSEVKAKLVLPLRLLSHERVKRSHPFYIRSLISNPSRDEEEISQAIAHISGFSNDDALWSINVSNRYSIPIGVASKKKGVFPMFSLFGRSCSPNAKFSVYLNSTLAVQAKNRIQEGEELTVCLTSSLEPTWKRRALLRRDYRYDCKCSRCSDPTESNSYLSALICQKCSGEDVSRYLIQEDPLNPKSPWRCRVHQSIKIFPMSLELSMQWYLNSLDSKTTISNLKDLSDCFGEILHPHHGLMMALKRGIISCYSQLPTAEVGRPIIEEVERLCNEQLDVLSKIDIGFPDWKGDILKHLSTAVLNSARLDMEEGKIQRPAFLLRVRKAMIMVEEGLKCKRVVKLDRKANKNALDSMVDELSSTTEDYFTDFE